MNSSKFFSKIVKLDCRNRLNVRGFFEEGDWVAIRRLDNGSICLDKIELDNIIYIGKVNKNFKIKLSKDAVETLMNILNSDGNRYFIIVKMGDKVLIGKPDIHV